MIKKTLIVVAALGLVLHLHGQGLPQTQIKDLNSGKKTAFNECIPKGKVTLVTFWGTWCVPGKQEAKAIYEKIADWKKQVAFNYLTIATEEHNTEEFVRTYTQKHGWNFPCYIDPNSDLKRTLGFKALPYIMIVDKTGKVVFTHTGIVSAAEIFARLKEVCGSR